MEEIRVYRSIWKYVKVILGSFLLAAASVLILLNHSFLIFEKIIAWIGVAFFGLGGLFLIFVVLKEKILGKPFLVITDKGVIVDHGKRWEVNFEDVEKFVLYKNNGKIIGIHYKKGINSKKLNDANPLRRNVRKFNDKIAGFQEGIPADNLTINAQNLCDLLNERRQLSINDK
jgi:hypothetical protein